MNDKKTILNIIRFTKEVTRQEILALDLSVKDLVLLKLEGKIKGKRGRYTPIK